MGISVSEHSVGADEKGEVRQRRKPKVKQAETWGEMVKAWPKTTFCIVSNEFCERFSYYGMRTVLTLYLLNILKFSDSVSTVFFNGFTVLCYLTPLLGSIIADGYIGKFKTIFIVSILYAIGQIMLAFSSIKNSESPIHPWLDLAGLIVIGFGTGGIKPCVASFGGDQFEHGQERMLSLFFSVFYFSINAGSMISTFISPLLRSTSCLGQDSCYPMAFGIPAVLMIVATVVFMLGSFHYKKPPPKENIFGEVFRLGAKAVMSRSKGPRRNHWLEYYLNTHSCEADPKCMELRRRKRDNTLCQKAVFINDVKSLLRVLVMYLPVPMFWALYDQQGSVWLIQAIQMDCRLWGSTLLLPDQMQTLNAVLILAFIPLFQVIIYPIVSKVVTLTPLRKMVAGGVIAAAAFVVSGFVQISVNKTLSIMPADGYAYVSVMNNYPGCNLTVTNGDASHTLQYTQFLINDKSTNTKEMFSVAAGNVEFNFKFDCEKGVKVDSYNFTGSVEDGEVYNLPVSKIGSFISKVDTDKPTEGTGEFSLSVTLALNDLTYTSHLALCRNGTEGRNWEHPCDPTRPEDFYYFEVNYNDGKKTDIDVILPYVTGKNDTGLSSMATVYKFKPVRPGKWNLFYMHNMAKSVGMKSLSPTEVQVTYTGVDIDIEKQGGVYSYILTGSYNDSTLTVGNRNQLVQDNTVSILWQVPQIVIITVAEILFSITGYEFAYSQAAPSMKALVQALWLLTTAIGDSIIVLIAALDMFSDQAVQAFAYAGTMFVVIIIFALLSIFYYDYKYYTGAEDDDDYDCESDEDTMSDEFSKDPYAIQSGLTNKGFDSDPWDERF